MSLTARELALDLGDGSYFPEVVEHVPGTANGLAILQAMAAPTRVV